MKNKALERDETSSLTNQLVQLSGRLIQLQQSKKTKHMGLGQPGWRSTTCFPSKGEDGGEGRAGQASEQLKDPEAVGASPVL